MEGRPITAFLVTALILWAIYLWRQGRLGQSQMLPGVKVVPPTKEPFGPGLPYKGGKP